MSHGSIEMNAFLARYSAYTPTNRTPKWEEFLRELTALSHRYGVGITLEEGQPATLFELSRAQSGVNDWNREYSLDDDGHLIFE